MQFEIFEETKTAAYFNTILRAYIYLFFFNGSVPHKLEYYLKTN